MRALFGPQTVFALRTQWSVLRGRGPLFWARWNAILTSALLRDRVNRRRYYRVLDEDAVRAARRSETVFVFGSGYSVNEIADGEWAHFREHDVFTFNAFYHQSWIPAGFHILRGGIYEAPLDWRPFAQEVEEKLAANPLYADTIYLMQDDYFGQFANQFVGYGLLPRGSRIFRYRTRRRWGPPTRSFREGIRHVVGTLDDAVNAAYLLGWKEIVLVGVDLYDSRYFWLAPDQTVSIDYDRATTVAAEYNVVRGQRYDELHSTARNGVVRLMSEWSEVLARDGVRLSVYNPRSLLAEHLPVYDGVPRELSYGRG
jgi:hypothetical protein